MKHIETVDARGLACPQPVLLAKKAIEVHDDILVIVDNNTAVENIKRMASKLSCTIQVARMDDGTYQIRLSKGDTTMADEKSSVVRANETIQGGPFVLVFSEDRMGRGDSELGYVLVKTFIHTLCQMETKPDTIIFYNTGVKLTVHGSEVVDDLVQLAADGVEILICGTCLNYFEISDKVGAGTISNMYDIAGTMCRAGRLVIP
ncbi:MAG: sulfurtransferase-like selenium metabolism protein YedF [Deltaproteobacteria bacterium]|nr:sulfurtransferase-like selenium metabolism protein YedF [Deltaproteobacteria bacterium]